MKYKKIVSILVEMIIPL